MFDKSYYLTDLNNLEDKSYILLHYIAKHNIEYDKFLEIDKLNENTKYIKDNFNYKAYDYYLMNWNHEILNNIDLNRNLFSETPLFDIYFKFNNNYDLANVNLLLKLLEIDIVNLKENLLALVNKKRITLPKNFIKSKNRYIKKIIETSC